MTMNASPAPARQFFLDTEFIDTGYAIIPISIALVPVEGPPFYAEVASPWRDHADAWTLEHIAPHLGSVPERTPQQLRPLLQRYVGAEPADFWAYFASYDWVVLCQLMGGMLNLPPNWSRWVRDLVWLDPTRQHIRALKVANPKPHHALYDAMELRDRYAGLKALGL